MPTKQRHYCRKCSKIATQGAYCDDHAPKRDYTAENGRRTHHWWDAWYKLAIWQDTRRIQLRREPLCRECLKIDIYTKATDIDHITPHNGDYDMFLDNSNLQSLCHQCHSRKTARENRANGIWK